MKIRFISHELCSNNTFFFQYMKNTPLRGWRTFWVAYFVVHGPDIFTRSVVDFTLLVKKKIMKKYAIFQNL
jgi:hypothetical protein